MSNREMYDAMKLYYEDRERERERQIKFLLRLAMVKGVWACSNRNRQDETRSLSSRLK